MRRATTALSSNPALAAAPALHTTNVSKQTCWIPNLSTARGPNLMELEEAIKRDRVHKFDPAWAYYEHLSSLVDLDIISSGELRVVADGMFGSGRWAIGEVLARGRTHVHNIRHEMNPGFGGIHPEPITRHLGLLMSTIQSGHWAVGLATDGDADRIGAVDAQGNFVDPHRIFALVLRYLLEKRGLRGKVVRTVSTTRMVDRIAAQYGLELIETPVGFNHIADLMIAGGVVMGGEESGGMSIQGHIPEGDGVLLGLLLLEVMQAATLAARAGGDLAGQIRPVPIRPHRPEADAPGGEEEAHGGNAHQSCPRDDCGRDGRKSGDGRWGEILPERWQLAVDTAVWHRTSPPRLCRSAQRRAGQGTARLWRRNGGQSIRVFTAQSAKNAEENN